MAKLWTNFSRAFILSLAAFGPLSGAGAATVTNVAELRYVVGGAQRTLQSNAVSFDTAAIRTAANVGFLRAGPGSDGQQVPQQAGQCKHADGSLTPIEISQQGLSTQSSHSLKAAHGFRAGETVYVTVDDPDQNVDPARVESVEVIVSAEDDTETVVLFETGANTGIFIGGIPSHGVPAAVLNDCRLHITSGVTITVTYVDTANQSDTAEARLLIDPYGTVFDSLTGAPVTGARVTLIDDTTGLPAQVFGEDGTSAYPASIVSGESVTDAAGVIYSAIPGTYRFPFVVPGRYRVEILPPAQYQAPSVASRDALGRLTNPSGGAFVIDDGSFGLPFLVSGPQPLRIDQPVDAAARALTLEKLTSTIVAESGDFVHYRLRIENRDAILVGPFTVTDALPGGFRYKNGSVRATGATVDVVTDADGRRLTFNVSGAAVNGTVEIGYTLVVGPDAVPGEAVNRAAAFAGDLAISNEASVSVRVRPPFLTDAATIIGRISEGQCGIADGEREGVPGIRMMLEDGTYAITDRDGRYHFEGVEPGLHVVQVDTASLPEGYELADCIRNSRHGGRSFSTFVELSGGALWRADFVVRRTGDAAAPASVPEPAVVDDATAAGANTDWLRGQSPGNEILFPSPAHNPRAPAQRLVVKHTAGTKAVASINGDAASPLAFDGVIGGQAEGVSISRWRGLPLAEGRNILKVEIHGAAGETLETLTREVWFVNAAARAEIVAGKSQPVADGRTRPVIAVRLTDAGGRPIRGGSSGSFTISAPYVAAAEVDTQQERQLAGLAARPTEWRVRGDDGIAYIELAPTTQTGTVTLGFEFQAERTRYKQQLETWLTPGDSDWVVVGYAAGTTGFNTLRDKARLGDRAEGETFTDGNVSLFAKGRILGKWLMTLAYDSDRKQRRPGEQRQLLRTIDPDRYYTVYGDGSEQRYDAPTSDKLYLRLERAQFYALYGDFETGLTRTELTRYNRTLTGVKAEYRGETLAVNAFAADTGLGFARDEIQGSGLSGPYRLSRRSLVVNSEKVFIEIRDRFRSEIVVSRTPQTRHVDYDLDPLAGTLRFREPIASRDENLNPQFIVVDYETENTARQYMNAGGRAAVRLAGGKVEAGASLLRDADNTGRSTVGGFDIRIQPRADTEIRLEAARSDHSGTATPSGEAYIAEVEHHGERLDVLGYFRQQDASFGVGQQNAAQSGTRKFGIDGSYSLSETLRFSVSAYRETYLVGPASRSAADIRAEYRRGDQALRTGFRYVDDKNRDGDTRRSELLTIGASQGFFKRKLTIDADAEIAPGDRNDSADFPAHYRIGARYALTPDVRIIVAHEISDGNAFDAQTTEVGFDIAPWKGGRLATTINQREMAEFGPRTFAALGLTQSLLVGAKWGVDAAFDSNSTLKGGIPAADILTPEHPAASGGFLGSGLTEDFWALSVGATYHGEHLSWTGRAEYRDGDDGDRYGFTTAVLRQTTGGIALAASGEMFRVRHVDRTSGETSTGTSALIRLSGAFRPAYSRWSLLNRLDLSVEDISGGALPGPFGFGPGVGGKSRRIVNNLALNRVSGNGMTARGYAHEQRAQASLYWGAKYVLDRYDGEAFGGFAQFIGAEVRRDVGERFDIGIAASVHHVAKGNRVAYSVGPNIGVSPFTNAWISAGYNVAGYHDRDFSESRYTRDGPYVTFRLKLDQLTPEAVFGRRSR